MTNMLNYVSAVNPSYIYGNINAADVKDFYIINPNGILFGANSRVITENLFVSTRSLTEDDIQNYVKYGTNPLDIAVDASRINDGGLKSSDIIGAYDIADGDVMFLGKVQANSLKVEGNVIQIRNTANILNNEGTEKLTNVTLISNNNPEVGYNVTTEGVDVESAAEEKGATSSANSKTLANPFSFDMSSSDLNNDDKISSLIEQYNLENNESNYWAFQSVIDYFANKVEDYYTATDIIRMEMVLDEIIQENISDGAFTFSSISDEEFANRFTAIAEATSAKSSVELVNPFNFDIYDGTVTDSDKYNAFIAQYGLEDNADNYLSFDNMFKFLLSQASYLATTTEQILATMAVEKVVQQSISDESFYWPSTYDSNYDTFLSSYNSALSSSTATAVSPLNTTELTNDAYKYFVADMVGDDKMPNSANFLGYKAFELD